MTESSRTAVEIPLADQIAEVERELALRRNVYASWIEKGKMKRDVAVKQMQRLYAVRDTLRNLEKVQKSLAASVV